MEGRVAMVSLAFLAYLIGMTVFDLTRDGGNPGGTVEEKDTSETKQQLFTTPTVRVLYCIS